MKYLNEVNGMILADKIIRLRKKNGWSQEELAEKMNVSRQAVSKWEGAQTVPDLEKILQLGELFGVTTDYLLKDEIENEEFNGVNNDLLVKRVTMQEANEYIEHRKKASLLLALGVFLCIMSPSALIVLSAATVYYSVSEGVAVLAGLVALLFMVAAAVGIFCYCGFRHAAFSYLNGEFETGYGVVGMVKEKDKQFTPFGIASNIIATCLCIISPVPLIASAFFGNEFAVCVCVAVLLLIVGIAVALFIIGTVRSNSMHRLLKDGEFSAEKKKSSEKGGKLSAAYWLITTAVYLATSFIANAWGKTWIIWPIAGVLFPVVYIIGNSVFNKKNK
ncbi:MAG: helix-turn-helix domain-containing protein [Clostridia bacterium]|nr:helix-turn-helix domain-containing protein [Clostridia bacterium]